MAIRQIHETARTEAEVKRRSREVIAYMKWRQGWQTMQSYERPRNVYLVMLARHAGVARRGND